MFILNSYHKVDNNFQKNIRIINNSVNRQCINIGIDTYSQFKMYIFTLFNGLILVKTLPNNDKKNIKL